MPNKPFEPTEENRKQVEAMKGYGIPEEQIAKLITNPNTGGAICRETLRKHFARELEVGDAKASAKIAESLYKQAIAGNTTASIWWTKTRMGWKETQVTEHSGEVKVSWQS